MFSEIQGWIFNLASHALLTTWANIYMAVININLLISCEVLSSMCVDFPAGFFGNCFS